MLAPRHTTALDTGFGANCPIVTRLATCFRIISGGSISPTQSTCFRTSNRQVPWWGGAGGVCASLGTRATCRTATMPRNKGGLRERKGGAGDGGRKCNKCQQVTTAGREQVLASERAHCLTD